MEKNIIMWSGGKNSRTSRTEVFSEDTIKKAIEKILHHKKGYMKGYTGTWMRMRDFTILNLIYLCALRPKEACKLRIEEVDFEINKIFINGDNNKVKKDRVIPLPIEAKKILLNFLQMPCPYSYKRKYFFPSALNESISPGTLKGTFREKVLKPCGLWKKPEKHTSSKTRLYSLRKSRATHLLQQSGDIYAVANLLGHKDTSVTSQYYIQTNEEYNNYLQNLVDGNIKNKNKEEEEKPKNTSISTPSYIC